MAPEGPPLQQPQPQQVQHLPTPVSEMRLEDEEEQKSDDEKTEKTGVIKNILAEDSQKQLWLVEWEDEEHGTWEEYETVKDSEVFKQHIHKNMLVREGLFVHPERQMRSPPFLI
jgi:hypothetical protein